MRVLSVKRFLIALLILVPFSVTLRAQSRSPGIGLVANAGLSRPLDTNGFGLAVGPSLKWNRFVGFAMADFTLYPGDTNPRYYIDTFSNGESRCRDRSNGQFADTGLCSRATNVITAGMFDGNLILSSVLIGAGYRVGDGRGAYGAIGYTKPIGRAAKSLWFVRATGGKDIVQVHIGIATHWFR